MAIALVDIFGSEIKVAVQAREVSRQYSHFAGANGLTAMFMGGRGHQIIVTGTVRAATTILLRSAILAIESWLWAGATDYTFAGNTYPAIVWERIEVRRDGDGKAVYWSANGSVLTIITVYGRALL